MKRFFIMILVAIIGVPLILGGVLAYSYYHITEADLPQDVLMINEQPVAASGYEWFIPAFSGIVEKEFYLTPPTEAEEAARASSPKVPVTFPEGYESQATVLQDGNVLWRGSGSEWDAFSFPSSGDYTLEVESLREKKYGAYGKLSYRVGMRIDMEPILSISGEKVRQGDVLAVVISRIEGDAQPVAEIEWEGLSRQPVFLDIGLGKKAAYLPISYNRGEGRYTMKIQYGEYRWTVEFEVTATSYERADIRRDDSDARLAAARSDSAIAEFQNAIYPLYETADSERKWAISFARPTSGSTITEYGVRQYFDGAKNYVGHTGVDIAGEVGDKVTAPSAGRVVFADELKNTGYTVVIEHGGGVKSYFYHMNGIEVEVDDVVERGEEIGQVGQTGDAATPHLHYEVRVANQSINPSLLFMGESGLFFEGQE